MSYNVIVHRYVFFPSIRLINPVVRLINLYSNNTILATIFLRFFHIYSYTISFVEILFPKIFKYRSCKTLNLYPTMAIHVPAYFHAIMQRGRTGNITLRNTATIIVDIVYSW